jgi:hypothetical protein
MRFCGLDPVMIRSPMELLLVSFIFFLGDHIGVTISNT